MFVHIDEDRVEFAGRLLEKIERVSRLNANAFRYAGAAKIVLGPAGVFRIAVGVEDFSLGAGGAGKPNGGIANGGAHLENAFRAAGLDQERQETGNRWADDRDPMLI